MWFQEWIDLLREMILKLPQLSNLSSLRDLCSGDTEVDFFNNIIHLQVISFYSICFFSYILLVRFCFNFENSLMLLLDTLQLFICKIVCNYQFFCKSENMFSDGWRPLPFLMKGEVYLPLSCS